MPKGKTKIGFRNQNGQVVERKTGLAGTDHNQTVYALRCDNCSNLYGANGSDIARRRCPICDAGRAGLPMGDTAAPLERPASEWAVAEAKSKFSELIDKAAHGPLTITKNGKPVAMVVGIEEWKRKLSQKGSLSRFFQSAPAGLADIDLARLQDESRDIDL